MDVSLAELLNFSGPIFFIYKTDAMTIELKLETWFTFLQTCALSNKVVGLPIHVLNAKSHSLQRRQPPSGL